MGKSKKIKQLIGLNYDYTNSYFNNYYNFESSNRISGSIYIQDVNIKRTVQFLVGSYGGKCQIKSFSVAILGCYNFILSKQETQNGYIKKSNGTIFPDSIPVINKKISNASDTSFVSLRLRLAYDLKLKNQKISIYIMRNFNIFNGFASEHSYLAPWWYIGLYYKPILARKKK
jgi:hypothetical protein